MLVYGLDHISCTAIFNFGVDLTERELIVKIFIFCICSVSYIPNFISFKSVKKEKVMYLPDFQVCMVACHVHRQYYVHDSCDHKHI